MADLPPRPWTAVDDRTWGPSIVAASTIHNGVTGEKTPVFVAHGLQSMALARLLAASADLLDALRPFAEDIATDTLGCHIGITTKEQCVRCSRILAAREAIARAEQL